MGGISSSDPFGDQDIQVPGAIGVSAHPIVANDPYSSMDDDNDDDNDGPWPRGSLFGKGHHSRY